MPHRTHAPTLHDLRELRNTMAHGHYISWNTLQTVRRLERALGG